MDSKIAERLQSLRAIMAEEGIDATIIPHVDPHQSEYIADHWQARRWLSGFTGSAGNLVVTRDKAMLWTDSRYFLQAAEQLADTPFILMKDGIPGTPSINQWLTANVKAGDTVGIDGMLFSHSAVAALKAQLAEHGIRLATDFDPIGRIWLDRPALPSDPVIIHDIRYAGEGASEKIAGILDNARKQGADSVMLTPLDEIAWTLNIRSTDVPCNPVATSYLYISPKGSTLFIDESKLSDEVRLHLKEASVDVAPYGDILRFLADLPSEKVLVEQSRVAQRLWEALKGKAHPGSSPVAIAKSCKNGVQIEGIRSAMERDGAALVRATMDIEKALAEGRELTEMGVAEILLRRRSEQPLFFDISFESIVGYGAHGAIVHYDPTPETDIPLKPSGLLLIDSGAQYLDGTTDITRTISLGEPTELEKRDFTLVMKGNIALSSAIYPEGTRGSQLDVLARQFLWKNGLSYLHGTGHGVGHFLNVHEGPQGIRLNDLPTPLMPGMVTSNEPGLYREGIHGIRCENLELTVEAFETEFGRFLKFETLTLFPFDRKLLDLSLLTPDEIRWIDDYHAKVYDRLSPLLNDDERLWLRRQTLPL